MFDVMAFHVDKVHICLDRLKLRPILPPKLMEDVDLLLLLTLGENTRADGEDGQTESHIEHFDHQVEHKALPLIHAGNTD